MLVQGRLAPFWTRPWSRGKPTKKDHEKSSCKRAYIKGNKSSKRRRTFLTTILSWQSTKGWIKTLILETFSSQWRSRPHTYKRTCHLEESYPRCIPTCSKPSKRANLQGKIRQLLEIAHQLCHRLNWFIRARKWLGSKLRLWNCHIMMQHWWWIKQ